MSGLYGRPLQLAQTNPLLVFAHSLIDVAFEPALFACHLKPHDAPARTGPETVKSLKEYPPRQASLEFDLDEAMKALAPKGDGD